MFRIRWRWCRRRQCHCHFRQVHSITTYRFDPIHRCRDTWPQCCRTLNGAISTKFANSISNKANDFRHFSVCASMRSTRQTTGKSRHVYVFLHDFCFESTHFVAVSLPFNSAHILSLSAIFSINNCSIHPNSPNEFKYWLSFVGEKSMTSVVCTC